MQIVILDDDSTTRKRITDIMIPIFRKDNCFVIKEFSNPIELIKHCVYHSDVCLAVLAIHLEDTLNGIEVGRKIKSLLPLLTIIYCSNYIDNHLHELINAESFHAIEKENLHLLEEAAKEARNRIRDLYNLGQRVYKYVFNGEEKAVELKKIVYFMSSGHKILIKTLSEDIYFYGKLDEVEINLYSERKKICKNK